mmetsp:Transcript_905/g.1350  ORF Transcript_905/g.1350 Transcript_905/m.1350 type:complete len:165 (-) Transcript_905:206-700(-)|eukprot:CAMPEP_0119109122 /NCGR_PEP_ID=MMETSP1180-20130426/17312_1 /TAXON_ID=3052 ORGANISM="Chlamydomonas cf sp, Strain CCMP681" /NCGR_SAMPLE_ID=MMETSP1180 /ASSEMBLY_ACC=CAM_ASM_000741 /LENGTH=164 /DNA_ID=CAMNT_0007094835 /DNA_START=82 /DNA_END=576 /DNA_ORIENTATION=-
MLAFVKHLLPRAATASTQSLTPAAFATKAAASKPSARPLSGYTLFVKQQLPIASKVPGSTPNELMRQVAAQWKGMSEKDQKPFLDLSEKSRKAYAAAKDATPKKPLTGYNLFVRERYPGVKSAGLASNTAQELLTQLATEWAALDEAAKNTYKSRATALKGPST